MKGLLIRVFLWPSGLAVLTGMSLLTLLVAYMPAGEGNRQASGSRQEFPGQRRGGGTHWLNPVLGDTIV